MKMQRKLLTAALSLGVIACAQHGKLALRPLPSPLAQGDRPVSFRVAEATAQMALGNVALALESFRKALREDPASIDALVGRAACYDAFGRFDLSRRDYEAALALAPADTRLLELLAGSLRRQGRGVEAAAIDNEITTRRAPSPTARAATSVTLPLPVARVAVSQSLTLVLPPSEVAPRAIRLERLSLGEVALITNAPAPASRPAAPDAAALPQAGALRQAGAPTGSLLRSAAFVPALRRDATISSKARPRPILVLNAARSEGLAGRTRSFLAARGFGHPLIGDAARPRARTLIIIPPGDRARALKLARAFAISPLTVTGTRLTLVLGRDAIRAARMKI